MLSHLCKELNLTPSSSDKQFNVQDKDYLILNKLLGIAGDTDLPFHSSPEIKQWLQAIVKWHLQETNR